jgi:hypothetical protein
METRKGVHCTYLFVLKGVFNHNSLEAIIIYNFIFLELIF